MADLSPDEFYAMQYERGPEEAPPDQDAGDVLNEWAAELTAARATIADLQRQLATQEEVNAMNHRNWERQEADLATARAEAEGLAALLAEAKKLIFEVEVTLCHNPVRREVDPPAADDDLEYEWARLKAFRESLDNTTPTEAAKRVEAMRTALEMAHAYFADSWPVFKRKYGDLTDEEIVAKLEAALSEEQEAAGGE